jgi:hypothetical protein
VAVTLGDGGLDDLDSDGSDFFADAVAGNDGDAGVGTAFAEWDAGHGDEDSRKAVTSGEWREKPVDSQQPLACSRPCGEQ